MGIYTAIRKMAVDERETGSPGGLTLVTCAAQGAAGVHGRKGHLVGPINGSRSYTDGAHFFLSLYAKQQVWKRHGISQLPFETI